MDVDDLVTALSAEGDRLVAAAGSTPLDATVPTCPEWTVRDLLQHLGRVHRWATAFVAEARTSPPAGDHELASPPDDDVLVPWLRDGVRHLVATLRDTDPAVQCWAFLRAESPLAFWARRQAHETTVHRADVEAVTTRPTPVAAAFAADGVEELLSGFFARRRGRLVADPPLTLGVRLADTGDAWSIEIRPDGRSVQRGEARGDCVVSGDASDVYFFLWNRRDDHGLDVAGDRRLLELWRDKARVSWS